MFINLLHNCFLHFQQQPNIKSTFKRKYNHEMQEIKGNMFKFFQSIITGEDVWDIWSQL